MRSLVLEAVVSMAVIKVGVEIGAGAAACAGVPGCAGAAVGGAGAAAGGSGGGAFRVSMRILLTKVQDKDQGCSGRTSIMDEASGGRGVHNEGCFQSGSTTPSESRRGTGVRGGGGCVHW